MKSFRLLVLLFTLAVSQSATAKDIRETFEQLRSSGENYEIVGVVCEQVARLELAETYPAPQFEIITGIEYGDKSRIIGELDVVVFNNVDHKAVVVAEVKCWENAPSGARKAMEQRTRFRRVAESHQSVAMKTHNDTYDVRQFWGPIKYMAISYLGTLKAGYDFDLEYTLEELLQLRKELISCQNAGKCKRF